MSIINSFLHKIKLHENQHGIFMVITAYVVSAALLILGSDVFYDITTKAERLSSTMNEVKTSESREKIINPYRIEEVASSNPVAEQVTKLEISDDTYWLLGNAMDEEEYHSFIAMLKEIAVDWEENAEEVADEEAVIESLSTTATGNNLNYSVTKDEIAMLERIVEAEATGEDMIGKVLIANVIFNRIQDEEFPDTVKEVIFQKVGGDYQFSPIADKRYWKVTVSEDTKEAVQRALTGEDYSEGALYFMARKRSKSSNVKWFDKNLDWLFKHGGHEFYKHR